MFCLGLAFQLLHDGLFLFPFLPMGIYNTGSRTGLIEALTEMCGELAPEETELRELTDSALGKLQAMSDAEFAELELYPDFDQ